ncbi:MAG: fibronectin type III domain-containing protein, partial [Clostridiaceae bacterium]|nr:fibronectin type III domain-containing protein [Clostridiaceae bacterium]
ITVTWDEVSDSAGDLWGYYIYRQVQEDPLPAFTYLGSINKASARSYTDYNITVGKSYKYAVSSRDDLGNESQRGESSTVSAPGYTPVITEFTNGTEPLIIYAGDTLSIKASGFKPYEAVTMHMDSEDASNAAILTRWADASGIVSISWRYVVNTTAGDHSITLKGAISSAKVTQSFTTLAPTTLPDTPAALNAANTGVLSVQISGYQVQGAAGYNIYRQATKTLESGEDEAKALLASNVRTATYTDLTVNNNKSYTYGVRATDSYGNEGPEKVGTPIIPTQDVTPPAVTLASSRSGSILNLYALVSDNIGVTAVEFFQKAEDGEYAQIGETINPSTGRGKSATVSRAWDTASLSDGSYTVKATVADRNGNTTEKTIAVTIRSSADTYTGTLTAAAEALRVKLSWTPSQDPELSSYRIYRQESTDNITWAAETLVASTSLLTYTDRGLSAAKYYRYTIAVLDSFGNESAKVPMAVPVAGYIVPLSDTDIPVIGSFAPAAGSTINKTKNISILASDNVGVSKIELFVKNAAGDVTIGSNKYFKIGESLAGTTGFGTIAFNTLDPAYGLADVSLELLTRVVDTSGNLAIKTVTYTLDNTAPPAPTLKVAAAELSVAMTITSGGAAVDFSHYNIYRSDTENGTYSLLTSVKTGSYFHREAKAAGNWYYVTAVDAVGNESAQTAKAYAVPGGDASAPTISALSPAADAPLRGTVTLSATASDNVGVIGIRFEFKAEGSSTWTTIADITSLASGTATYVWNTVAESAGVQLTPDGTYEIRAAAYDSAGNTGYRSDLYTIANDPPAPPTGLEVYSGQWQLIISYNTVGGSDFAYYKIYRKLSSESEFTFLAQTTGNVYVDKGLN